MAKGKKQLLTELENIFVSLQYKVRYEKGNFQSGYCLVENSKIVVINKFFDVEGRANSLIEILREIKIDPSLLAGCSKEILDRVTHKEVENTLF